MRAFESSARGDAPRLSHSPAALLAACGSGDGFVGSGGAIGPLAPNFDSIQANVFEPVCEHCHSGANAPAGLRLDAANSYVASSASRASSGRTCCASHRATPNNSYLIQKLEGTAGVGERMPAGLPAAAAERHQHHPAVDRRRRAAGLGRASGPIRVTSLSPAPHGLDRRMRRRSASPASITVGFDRELNAPSVTTASFTLQRGGADGHARHGRRRRDHAGVRDCARREPALGRHGSHGRAARARPLRHHARSAPAARRSST